MRPAIITLMGLVFAGVVFAAFGWQGCACFAAGMIIMEGTAAIERGSWRD